MYQSAESKIEEPMKTNDNIKESDNNIFPQTDDNDVEFDVCKRYFFITGQVPKFHYTDPTGLKLIEEQVM